MSMVLNEEQLAAQDAAKKLIQNKSPVSALRRIRDNKDASGFDAALWDQMIELGWTAMIIPEEYGGLGLSHDYMSAVLEECGRTLTPSPLWSSCLLCAGLINNASNMAQKQEILPAIATGDVLVSLAMEEQARHQPIALATRMKAKGENFLLTGKKHFVVNGHMANYLIINALSENDEQMLVIVECERAGIEISRNWMVDGHNSATVSFQNVNVSKDDLLFDNALDTKAGFERGLDIARLGLAAEMLGTASEAFDRTLAYLKERQQFGAIIGSFQALKHRAAEMFCELELSRSTVREGFSAIADPAVSDVELGKLASIAKTQLTQTLRLVANEAVQMHGGIGMTDEHEIGFYLKRARVLEHLLGDDVYHVRRFADLSGF